MNARISLLGLWALAGLSSLQPAAAQSPTITVNGQPVCSGLLASIFNRGAAERVARSWAQIEPETQNCVAQRTGSPVSQLAARCIGADDQRIVVHIQACRQATAQARKLKEDEVRRAAAQREDEARRATAQRDARERERIAEEQAKIKAEERKRTLNEKYGAVIADHILAGRVVKNMTEEQVLEAAGQPSRKERIPPNFELWIYRNQRIAILNGRVTHAGE